MKRDGEYKDITDPCAPLFFERPLLNHPEFVRPPRSLRRVIGRYVRRGQLRKQSYRIYSPKRKS